MELFRSLRVRAGRSMLSGRLAKTTRKQRYINFCNIKSIGIVWDASKPEDFVKLSRFHQKMSEQNKEVKIFGFFPGNILPDQYVAIRFLTCLKKTEVDFLYRPVTPDSKSFIKTKFDVLIDINFKKHFPLVYITFLSEAYLKVGLADSEPESSPFDLMISLKSPVSIDSYLDQVIYYLEMINSESVKKAV
ncbi:MAG: hypothetical protein A2Y71_16510 [Bacteroidetes bacterium RBG_13_42_15]|nr:MAG: hypothetical protein A2Y71_16510 [Bacteroidetes bacterium RBG_13_42_15]